jgi:hypothetical protein
LFFGVLEGGIRLYSALYIQSHRDQSIRGDDHFLIFTVGDSFTIGLGVDKTESYPYQLERRLNHPGERRVKVNNVGHPGKSPNQMRRDILKKIDRTKPDMILLLAGFNMNDADIDEYEKVMGFDPGQEMSSLVRLRGHLMKLRFVKALNWLIQEYRPKSLDSYDKRIKGMKRFSFSAYQQVNYWALQNLVDLIQGAKVPLILMNYPQATLPDNNFTDREFYYYHYGRRSGLPPLGESDYLFSEGEYKEIAINRIIRRIAMTSDLELIDHVRSFSKIPASEYDSHFLPRDEHPNQRGYERMVDEILKVIPVGVDGAK